MVTETVHTRGRFCYSMKAMSPHVGRYLRAILLPGIALGIFVLFGSQASAAEPCRLAVVRESGEISAYRCSARLSEAQATAYLTAQPGVRLVAPVREYNLQIAPNDTYFSEQGAYLRQIRALDAWDKPLVTTQRPIIAVLDSGVDIDHVDLSQNIWFNPWEVPGDRMDNDGNGYVDDQYGWDFIGNVHTGTPKFEEGWTNLAMQHGTIVAGVAAAVGNNAQGVTGLAWRARIMPVRVLNSKGTGDTVTVAKGIEYAIKNHADIINLSFVGPLSDPVLDDAIRRAYAAGVLVVAAAGNEAGSQINMDVSPQFPVCDDGRNGENRVIGVAAVDEADRLAAFSNYGSRCIDISAPGTGVYSTQFMTSQQSGFTKPYGGYWSGTSVAAPMVSGALALVKAAHPTFSASQVRDMVLTSGDQIDLANPAYRGKLGRRLNVRAALDLADSSKFPKQSPVIVAPYSGAAPDVSVFDQSGGLVQKFQAYAASFRGGVQARGGDVDRDGEREIVTVPRSAGGPHVRIFSQRGELEYQFMAVNPNFRGGLSLAIGEISGNDRDDIVLGVGPGASNLVLVFDFAGNLQHQFVPYASSYTGGVNVGVGDLDSDGYNEIVAAPMTGGKLPVRVFDRRGTLIREFAAFPALPRGGANLSVGDVDGDGRADIVIGAGMGGGPQVRVFNGDGKLLSQFFAYDSKFRGGVQVAVGDTDGDGKQQIVTAPGVGGGPQVRVFNVKGEAMSQFFVEPANFRGGLSIGVYR